MSQEKTFHSTDLPNPAPKNSIVVGHDGSEGANYAFIMALELGEQLSTPVIVVRSWSTLTVPPPTDREVGYASSFDECASAVREEMIRTLQKTAESFGTVQVAYEPVHAPPAESLIAASRDARMLVVGTRGHGRLAGMLLGSVSEKCVRHAVCPVLVVRPRD